MIRDQLARDGEAKGQVRKPKDDCSHVLQIGVKLSVELANKMHQGGVLRQSRRPAPQGWGLCPAGFVTPAWMGGRSRPWVIITPFGEEA